VATGRDEPIRVLLVDDHEIVRRGLRMLLDRSGGITVVGEAGTVQAAVPEAVRLRPDVVLMDISLPDGSGVTACREIRLASPGTRVVFLSSFLDDEAVMETAIAGGDGYLLKEISEDVLIGSIEMVARGQSIIASAVRERVRERAQQSALPEPAASEPPLTPQEWRILALVAKGQTNKAIGAAVSLSPKTVRNYLSTIFQKLHVTRRSEAASHYTGIVSRRPTLRHRND